MESHDDPSKLFRFFSSEKMDKALEMGACLTLFEEFKEKLDRVAKSEFLKCRFARSHTISCAHSGASEIETN